MTMVEEFERKRDNLAQDTIRKFMADGMTEAQATEKWQCLCVICGENAYDEFKNTGKPHICPECQQ